MGTSAFDRLWESPAPSAGRGDALDALWDHPATDAAAKLHAEYASGRLAKRIARENTNDREMTEAEQVSPLRAFGESLAATGANLAQGIPGMEAAQAGVRSLARGQPYKDALSDIRGATDKLPTVLKYGERIAGALPLAAVLPASPVASGAIVGGADQALSADPDMSLTERGLRTAAGAGLGAATGKLTDMAVTGAKSLFAKNPASLLLQKQAERAASAKNLYAAAIQEGRNNGVTPEIQQFLNEEDIAPIVEKIQEGRTGSQLDTPQLLDRVYKELSSQAKGAGKQLASIDPKNPSANISRLADIKAAKSQALEAMGGTPGYSPMPSYAKAVDDYAQRTREIEAVKKGYDALRSSLSSNLPTANNLTRKTPQAFAEWVAQASPEEIAAARQGILGGAKLSMHGSVNPLKVFGAGPSLLNAGKAAPLLRAAATTPQAYIEILQNLGLLTAGNAASP